MASMIYLKQKKLNPKNVNPYPRRSKESGYISDEIPRRRESGMRVPNVDPSLSWKKNTTSDGLLSSAVSSDGNFIESSALLETNPSKDKPPSLSANQLVAKAIQLRMKGRHELADQLLKEAENSRAEEETGRERLKRRRNHSCDNRYAVRDVNLKQTHKEGDNDEHLAERIMKIKHYSLSCQNDEYDFDEGPLKKKSRKRTPGDQNRQVSEQNHAKRISTQQERCQLCFENPNRPKHLVVAIANSAYLMLPRRQPIVPGHCCILPLQHESATTSLDDDICWDEIRNFKKCLIMMFAKQGKDVVFLETVKGLAQQRRHCLIECIPLPKPIAKEAPLFFKKAIDEAEDVWSQHDAKKLIDTSQKGLRACIPKNFPYFHVEFGLSRGFVHVIDDETKFDSSFGLEVIRGMLKAPEAAMHRNRRCETIECETMEAQKQAVADFVQAWKPFDWTMQL